ncbi:MAG: epoxide hydrolase [Chloroflexi bacterium]|nr:epoxide hydrolase [Chloroflexota bacterium]
MATHIQRDASTPSAISAFRVDVPEETTADLRRRIEATRFADKELVPDQSQGVQLATIQELARYWANDYDMGRLEARLNALPQFRTEIDGLDIYFIHVRSKHDDALPLIVTRGWPGSIVELLNTIDPLTNPTAHGGSALDAFHLVIPSMPGYGFSARPTAPGWDPAHIARAWDTLMKRLGYGSYVSQGGDWGALITELLQRQAPAGLLGVHVNFLFTRPPEIGRALALGEPAPAGLSEEEKAAYEQLKARGPSGYGVEQATRPQTIGQSLADSPVGLAAWLLDHDPRSYEKMVHAFQGRPEGQLTRDQILDNITLYWVTHTETSAARLYWEVKGQLFLPASNSAVPAAMTVFPDEYYRAPRSWAEWAYPNLISFNKVDRGGHFAAWEEPELFSSEVSAAFRSLR